METSANQDATGQDTSGQNTSGQNTNGQNTNGQASMPIPAEQLPQAYQEALLRSGVQAANLLAELIALKLMPDPRAKEMAEVAIEVLKIVRDSSAQQSLDAQLPSAKKPSKTARTAKAGK